MTMLFDQVGGYLLQFEQSPLVAGLAILISNLGARYMMVDFDGWKSELFQTIYMRVLAVICTAFMVTRNIMTSLFIGFLFFVFVKLPTEFDIVQNFSPTNQKKI